MADSNGATVVATGMLPALLIVSAVLTAIASAWLLRLYRRAVVRSMAKSAGAVAPLESARSGSGADPAALRIIRLDPRAVGAEPLQEAAREGVRATWRAAGVYAAAGLAYALILATPWMVFAGGELLPGRMLWLVACYAWPVVLGVGLVAATGLPDRIAIASTYLGALALVVVIALAGSPDLQIAPLAFFWLYVNAPGTVLLAGFLRRRVRAVGPLVFAFTTAAVAGAFLAIELANRNDSVLHGAVRIGATFGLGATGIFVVLHLLGFAGFAAVGWTLLGWIGRRYQAKRFSDESLTLDALWLLFAVAQSFTFAFEAPAWILTGPVAFAAYKLVTATGFRWLAVDSRRPGGTLLVLRVFALGPKSQRLFDAIAKRWLRSGPITLIAGPDLATATVEPHEFLEFVGGRLSRQFVQDEGDLTRRLAALDTRRDPDGRYRVTAFFCHADTWQPTMRRLAARSDGVLMDLRSFSETSRGCVYELAQLLDGVALNRVVFIVDASTDVVFLEQILADVWRTTSAGSPNRQAAAPTARLCTIAGPSRRELDVLMGMLSDAAVWRAP